MKTKNCFYPFRYLTVLALIPICFLLSFSYSAIKFESPNTQVQNNSLATITMAGGDECFPEIKRFAGCSKLQKFSDQNNKLTRINRINLTVCGQVSTPSNENSGIRTRGGNAVDKLTLEVIESMKNYYVFLSEEKIPSYQDVIPGIDIKEITISPD